MRRLRGKWALAIAAVTLLAAFAGWRAVEFLAANRLPYHDSFARNAAAEWTPIGGNWQLTNGEVVNRSDESGAKLVTGSNRWKDYELDADLKLIGHDGDIGMMARVRDEDQGADSYNGYYIGLRSGDSALVIGRADHGWMEGQPVAMPGGVQIGVWYHLRVVIVGCDIGAQATNLITAQTAYAAFVEKPCVPSGKIGLRSMATGGAWRNVAVQPATYAQFAALHAKSAVLTSPVYPMREDDYDHMREAYFRSTFLPARSYRQAPPGEKPPEAEPIAAARSSPSEGSTTLRGVVTLTSPLYIQDNSGGVVVQLLKPVALNLGDEVEVAGTMDAREVSPRFIATDLTLRGDRTLVVPVSVTSTQAAGGAFDARLVELRGTLREKQASGEQITLQMEDAEQTFRAVGSGDLSLRKFNGLAPGSELRIRGICTVGPGLQPGSGAFTILLRSMEDVEVLSGPPWWSPRILPRYIVLLFALIAMSVYLYLRIERSKMVAILDERERLAYDMHDTLAQSFAGVGFHLQGMRNGLRSGSLALPAALEKLDVACDLVTHTHREASAEIAALHPDASEDSDLLNALERSTHAMLEGDPPPLALLREGSVRELSLTCRDALFQIGRESIANIFRHSNATQITLKLLYQSRYVVLEVRDNGCGFSYAEHAEDFGIRAMRRRAQRAGGTVAIDSVPGKGTCVRAQMPYGTRFGFIHWTRSGRAPARVRSR
jgi:signal transduction histidine kinase